MAVQFSSIPADPHLDRNYHELLQEVRVAQSGVQVLLAFLLWVAFSPGVHSLNAYQRWLYVAALVLAALSIALLIAPAGTNRIIHRSGLRAVAIRLASRCAVGGLGLLFAALSCAMVLIFDVVIGSSLAMALGLGIVAWFAAWWYVVPLLVQRRHTRQDPRECRVGEQPMGLAAPGRVLAVAMRPSHKDSRLAWRWQERDGNLTGRWNWNTDLGPVWRDD